MEKCRRELARLLAKCINFIMALRHLISQPLLNERLQCPNGLWLTGNVYSHLSGMSRTFFRRPRSRKTGKAYICPQLRDGATDGELAEVHHRPAQKQEQWKPGLGENQAYRRDEDRSDVGRMENGTYHFSIFSISSRMF